MIKIYTDGSARFNPGPGGYGVAVIEDEKVIHTHSLFHEETTNNREEMKAIIYAIGYVIMNDITDYEIYSDSAYCVNMCHDWIWTWAENGWRNSKREEVKNIDLVQCLYGMLMDADCAGKIVKVKGHDNNLGNEIADALATDNKKKLEKLGVEI